MNDKKSAGPIWDDVRRELFTPDEIAASNKRVAEILDEVSSKSQEDTRK